MNEERGGRGENVKRGEKDEREKGKENEKGSYVRTLMKNRLQGSWSCAEGRLVTLPIRW